VNPLNYSNHLR